MNQEACFHYCESSLLHRQESCLIENKIGRERMGQKKLCSAKSNPSNTSNPDSTSKPALTCKSIVFFRVLLFAVIHSTAPFTASSRQLAHQLSQANWFAPRGKSKFSSEEIPRTQLLRIIFCTGTVYYLNKFQGWLHIHPSLSWPNYISTCS